MSEHFFLEKAHIIDAHTVCIEDYGGASGVLNESLIDSIIGSVELATQYQDMSVFEVAAKYGYKLVMNHCFEDGNKRVGAYVSMVYLQALGIQLNYTQEEAVSVFLGIAKGEISELELAQWLEKVTN